MINRCFDISTVESTKPPIDKDGKDMISTKNYSMEKQATIAFIVAQILFKIIFEFEGSAIFGEAHSVPTFAVIVVLTIIWGVICVLCLLDLKLGYLLGVVVGILNFFPLVLLAMGIAPFENRPYFNAWITFALIYFSYRTYKSYGTGE